MNRRFLTYLLLSLSCNLASDGLPPPPVFDLPPPPDNGNHGGAEWNSWAPRSFSETRPLKELEIYDLPSIATYGDGKISFFYEGRLFEVDPKSGSYRVLELGKSWEHRGNSQGPFAPLRTSPLLWMNAGMIRLASGSHAFASGRQLHLAHAGGKFETIYDQMKDYNLKAKGGAKYKPIDFCFLTRGKGGNAYFIDQRVPRVMEVDFGTKRVKELADLQKHDVEFESAYRIQGLCGDGAGRLFFKSEKKLCQIDLKSLNVSVLNGKMDAKQHLLEMIYTRGRIYWADYSGIRELDLASNRMGTVIKYYNRWQKDVKEPSEKIFEGSFQTRIYAGPDGQLMVFWKDHLTGGVACYFYEITTKKKHKVFGDPEGRIERAEEAKSDRKKFDPGLFPHSDPYRIAEEWADLRDMGGQAVDELVLAESPVFSQNAEVAAGSITLLAAKIKRGGKQCDKCVDHIVEAEIVQGDGGLFSFWDFLTIDSDKAKRNTRIEFNAGTADSALFTYVMGEKKGACHVRARLLAKGRRADYVDENRWIDFKFNVRHFPKSSAKKAMADGAFKIESTLGVEKILLTRSQMKRSSGDKEWQSDWNNQVFQDAQNCLVKETGSEVSPCEKRMERHDLDWPTKENLPMLVSQSADGNRQLYFVPSWPLTWVELGFDQGRLSTRKSFAIGVDMNDMPGLTTLKIGFFSKPMSAPGYFFWGEVGTHTYESLFSGKILESTFTRTEGLAVNDAAQKPTGW